MARGGSIQGCLSELDSLNGTMFARDQSRRHGLAPPWRGRTSFNPNPADRDRGPWPSFPFPAPPLASAKIRLLGPI